MREYAARLRAGRVPTRAPPGVQPGEGVQTPTHWMIGMSQLGVQVVIGKLMTDEEFRRQLQERGAGCLQTLRDEGILLDDAEIAVLVEADPHLWSRMAKGIDRRLQRARTTPAQRDDTPLTVRQREVLRGVFEGLTNKEIASCVGVSESAVKATVQQLFRKARVRTRAQLVRVAIEGSAGAARKPR
jgi:DNA-binding NarL/FixJ family response regulator